MQKAVEVENKFCHRPLTLTVLSLSPAGSTCLPGGPVPTSQCCVGLWGCHCQGTQWMSLSHSSFSITVSEIIMKNFKYIPKNPHEPIIQLQSLQWFCCSQEMLCCFELPHSTEVGVRVLFFKFYFHLRIRKIRLRKEAM